MVPCWFECLIQNVYFQGYVSVHDQNAARIQGSHAVAVSVLLLLELGRAEATIYTSTVPKVKGEN